jgi:hypothetical protein
MKRTVREYCPDSLLPAMLNSETVSDIPHAALLRVEVPKI